MAKTKKAKAHLPKHTPKMVPPRKSGRRGIGPAIDPEEDRQTTVTQDPEPELLVTLETGKQKKPRQARLPQMEDPQIEELEGSAENYADIRDQRMELTKEETSLKDELLTLMKKHGKTSYVHDGYDIKVIVESEKLKVRIKKEE
jgi:hypothetical protein